MPVAPPASPTDSSRQIALGADGCERLVSALRSQRNAPAWELKGAGAVPETGTFDVLVRGSAGPPLPAHASVLRASSPFLARELERTPHATTSPGLPPVAREISLPIETSVLSSCLDYAHFRRADVPWTSRGAAAAATWKVRGDESRRRRGRDVDIPWRRDAAPPRPRRGQSVETRRRGRDADIPRPRGRDADSPWRRDAAAATRTVRGDESPAAATWTFGRSWRAPRYGALVRVDDSNVEAILAAAARLEIAALAEECSAFVACRTTPRTACKALALANRHRLAHLRRDVLLCVLFHFEAAAGLDAPDEGPAGEAGGPSLNDDAAGRHAAARGFAALTPALVEEVLGDDRLNADEAVAFRAAVAWLEADPPRSEVADAVLGRVRLPLVDPVFLADVVEPHALMAAARVCTRRGGSSPWSRRRRGRDADSPLVAATPRLRAGSSESGISNQATDENRARVHAAFRELALPAERRVTPPRTPGASWTPPRAEENPFLPADDTPRLQEV